MGGKGGEKKEREREKLDGSVKRDEGRREHDQSDGWM